MKLKLILVVALFALLSCSGNNWRTASRAPAGIAVNPMLHTDAVIEFYAADAYSWRGWFAVHSWIAIKEKEATEYTVYEVVGWRTRHGQPALRQYNTISPDRYWYGAKPEKFYHLTGEKAETLIPQMREAIAQYPWANEYTLFPGPNSNTFPAWVAKQVPDLQLQMPFRAIGSGYAN
ncbi:DUF3750 domain-containing protein [Planctobacterium marinum]|uniref:DUF3750 domain-containing protein n=1 Tax=Planctobacterium marinum TaxID=1631968 RepID=UPI001E567E7A|nr:DUF3750 domain-containing protein [Planctobacterium marinum]MCC2608193.1 DUF3750 domain-containing protein [Planctobacterium marinum]